jgi:hypothetical protein
MGVGGEEAVNPQNIVREALVRTTRSGLLSPSAGPVGPPTLYLRIEVYIALLVRYYGPTDCPTISLHN